MIYLVILDTDLMYICPVYFKELLVILNPDLMYDEGYVCVLVLFLVPLPLLHKHELGVGARRRQFYRLDLLKDKKDAMNPWQWVKKESSIVGRLTICYL